MVSVVGEALTVDCESRMERVAAPMVSLLAGFAWNGGAGTGRRPAWGLLALLVVMLCFSVEQPIARSVSCGRGAVSMGSWWSSKVGGLQCLVCLARPAALRTTVTGVVASRL